MNFVILEALSAWRASWSYAEPLGIKSDRVARGTGTRGGRSASQPDEVPCVMCAHATVAASRTGACLRGDSGACGQRLPQAMLLPCHVLSTIYMYENVNFQRLGNLYRDAMAKRSTYFFDLHMRSAQGLDAWA